MDKLQSYSIISAGKGFHEALSRVKSADSEVPALAMLTGLDSIGIVT